MTVLEKSSISELSHGKLKLNASQTIRMKTIPSMRHITEENLPFQISVPTALIVDEILDNKMT